MEDQKWVELAVRQQSLCLLLEDGESRKSQRLRINCRMCSCCFKTQFGNFMSGWIRWENVFVAATRKEKRYQSWLSYWKMNFSLSSRKENLSSREFALCAEQRLETALRRFRKLEKNWICQLTMNNYRDWKEWVNPLIPIHFFVIWLCKSLSLRI